MELPRGALAPPLPFASLYELSGGDSRATAPLALTEAALGELLRCAFGLSAWKQHQSARWPLRVNPSSGNLHPTEAYVIASGVVSHYAPDDHVLEQRARLDAQAWPAATRMGDGALVALSSIGWREAWKYGERAFRYCQHDIGHAIGALRYAAALLGWRVQLLPEWSDSDVSALVGIDRDEDFAGAEREWPACIALVTAAFDVTAEDVPRGDLLAAARSATWSGRANRLSASHVAWPAIDAAAAATRYGGSGSRVTPPRTDTVGAAPSSMTTPAAAHEGTVAAGADVSDRARAARDVILGRRSAVAFDPRGTLPRAAFARMLARLRPAPTLRVPTLREPTLRGGVLGAPVLSSPVPWDVFERDDIGPQVHLVLFVHRVDGLAPGIYAFLRDDAATDQWRSALRPEFLWEPAGKTDLPGLYLLVPSDVTWAGTRLCCDQDIAGDGFFSLGMVARFEPALREHGEWCYRRLFWECGLIGQVLYLEAEAHGVRGTGIGCFYDDAVHDTLGLSGHDWQSLYHFSMGVPVDDPRLSTYPGYDWESAG